MTCSYFYSLFILIFAGVVWCSWAYAASGTTIMLPIPLGGTPTWHAFDSQLQKSFKLGEFAYTSDTPFDRDEFLYLMDMKPGDRITAAALKKSIIDVAKKNKFSLIRLEIVPSSRNKDVEDMHITFESFWILKRVSISGILNGRDKYRYLYDIDLGEAFDEKKHKHSIGLIKEELDRQGYLCAVIRDTCTKDHNSKSLSVNLDIQRGPRFHIGSVDVICDVAEDHKVPHSECVVLHEKIKKFFAQRLELRPYSSDLLNKQGKALKKFLAKKGFLQALVTLREIVHKEEHTVGLAVHVTLHGKKEFVFFGNHFISDQQLQEIILSFGQSILLVPTSLLAQEIESHYQKKGFLKVKVESREEDSNCYFVITEGKRAFVDRTEIHGVKQLSSELATSGVYARLKKQRYFDEERLKRLIESLELFYRQSGFSLVRVSYEACESAHVDHYVIHIKVDEGKRYYLNKISIPAFPELEHQGPFASFSQSRTPVPFDSHQLLLQRRWLLDYLHQQGYLYVTLKPVVTVKQGACCLVDVTWDIVLQQDKVTFGKTIIVGTCPLPFKRFMRELQYQQGEPWNKAALENSLLRLRDLKLFSNMRLYPENITNVESEKTIMAKLVEDDPFELRFRAGLLGVSKNLTWREGATYKIGGSLLCKNIFDSGGQLRFDADLTKFERYISGYYIYPWFFDMPYTTIMKAYSNRYRQPVVQGSKDQLYEAVQQGFLVGLNRKYTHITTGLNIGFELMETILKNKAAAEAINFSPSLVDVKVPYLYLEPTIVADYLDDKLYPTRGSFTLASIKGMIPLSKINDAFIKVLLEQSFFCPLYQSLIGGFRVRIGHIFNQCFNQIMPPERFYLGGANSVRGYEPDFAPPLGCFESLNRRKKLVPQGGKSMLNVNMELRFPLFKSFIGALFQDAGVLVGDDVSVVQEQAVAATGCGIRYNTPVGPLRFDIGFKWKKLCPDDSRMAWYLTLGNAF